MTADHHSRPRGFSARLLTLAAIAGAALALAFSGGHTAVAEPSHMHAGDRGAGPNARELAFHDRMRKLWEDHVTWTRLAIVSFAGELPDFEATAARLLANQKDIGDAIRPYYGAKAGHELTALLEGHIAGAVEILEAAKANDTAGFESAKAAWYRNGDQIARFLSKANPRQWRFKAVDRMMREHLDQTLKEAADRLAGDYGADIRDYEVIHRHILEMADMLSGGIVAQFPQRFR